MIVFTTLKDIPYEYMAYKNIRSSYHFNLGSYLEGMPLLDRLIPNFENVPEDVYENLVKGNFSTPEFDIMYHNSIMSDDGAFAQLMAIIIPEFNETDSLILIHINESEFRDVVVQSLMKLIQQRYGVSSYFVRDVEDFLYVEEQSFSIPGLFAIQKDLDRWRYLMIASGNAVIEDD